MVSTKLVALWPFWMTDFDRISRHSFVRISLNFKSIHNFVLNVFTKWPPVAILDDRKSLSISFRAISRHFISIRNFILYFFFHKMATGGVHFGWSKITFDCIFLNFRSIRNFFLNTFFSILFFKMTAGGSSTVCYQWLCQMWSWLVNL